MSTSSDQPQMHIDAISFLRLLPPNREEHPAFDDGLALLCSSDDKDDLDYLLTMSRHDAERLAKDILAHFAGEIDIANPGNNYGRH